MPQYCNWLVLIAFVLAVDNRANGPLIVAGHFEKTATIDDHLVKVKWKAHRLMINFPLVLTVIVVYKMMGYS